MSTSLRLAKLATNLDVNGDLTSVGGLTYPSADGTAGQVLTTDGSGTLSFGNASSVSSVADLTDVDLTGLANNAVLKYDATASEWIVGTTSTAQATANVIVPFAFANVATTSNGSGTNISWSNWNSSNSTLDFTFGTPQANTNYAVITDSETFDDYFVGISNKTTTGFRAEFYDNSGSRTPSSFSPFSFVVYAETPTETIYADSYSSVGDLPDVTITSPSSGEVLKYNGTAWVNGTDSTLFTASVFHTLDNPNAYSTGTNDYFGNSVAVSGNYAIVGARGEDDAGGTESGKAYIFNVTTGALVHTLDNPNAYDTSANDNFGYSVAISGNYAIVSALGEDDAGGGGSGKVYIFNVSTGALLHTLDNPNAYSTSAGDNFGYSAAISGNYAIVSAAYEGDSGGGSSGKAYIFDVTTGTLVHTLDNPSAYGTSAGDEFGFRVAISGNYAIVSARGEGQNAQAAAYVGKAYIFNVTTGALVHTLDNPNAYSTYIGDLFGTSVAISGNYAIVGVPYEDDAGGSESGKAYIFNVTTGALLHTLDNPNAYSTSASDLFGDSVAISGNYAIVGVRNEDDAGGSGSGKAYIFEVSTGTLVATVDNPNAYSTSADDNFGVSVAISGNYAIIGADGEDEQFDASSGKSYIYQLPTAQSYAVLDSIDAAGFSGGISNVVEDTTPQLGGDLDLNLKSFSGTASFKSGSTEMLQIVDGAGLTMVQSNTWPLLINTSNSTISLTAGTSELGGGSINLRTENQSRIEIASTGPITFNNSYTFPTTDGSSGQVLTTNGSGTLSWSTPASGGGGSFADRYVAAILF